MAQQFIGSDGTYIDPQVLAAARLASNNAQRYRQDSRGLGGLLGSLAAKAGDVWKSTIGTIGGGVAAAKDLAADIGSGFQGPAHRENQEAWAKHIYGTDSYKDATAKQLGTAINAADTLTDFVPGVALAKANPLIGAVAGGISGFGNTLKYEGADFDWNDAGNSIASGAITGAVTAGFNRGLNNATKGIGKKIASNAIARGATSGALGGAIGAGVSGALNQQDLGSILGNMASSAAQGAVSGAAMSGISQLGTKAKNAALGKFWGQTPDQVANTIAQADQLRLQDRADDGKINNSIPALKAQTETTEETTTGPTKYMAENSVKRPVVEVDNDRLKEASKIFAKRNGIAVLDGDEDTSMTRWIGSGSLSPEQLKEFSDIYDSLGKANPNEGKTKYMNESVGKQPSVGSDDIKQLAEDYKADKLTDSDVQGILEGYELTTGRNFEDMNDEFNRLTGKNVGNLMDRQDEITARLQKALNSGKTKYMNESVGKQPTIEATLSSQSKNMTKAQIIDDLIENGSATGYSQNQLKRMTKSQLLELADNVSQTQATPKEDMVTLYRGLTEKYDPNYPSAKLSNANGYESWTDNYDLAKQYGDNVYSIEVPKNSIKAGYMDEDPSSPTYGDRNFVYKADKPAGLNGVPGNEYLLYTAHDDHNGLTYNEVPSDFKPTQSWLQSQVDNIVDNFDNMTSAEYQTALQKLADIYPGFSKSEADKYVQSTLNTRDLINTLKDVGADVDENGNVKLYHRTTPENANEIYKSGKMYGKDGGLYFSTNKDSQPGYGDGVVELNIPAEKLALDDLFDNNADLKYAIGKPGQLEDISEYLVQPTADPYAKLRAAQNQLDVVDNKIRQYEDQGTVGYGDKTQRDWNKASNNFKEAIKEAIATNPGPYTETQKQNIIKDIDAGNYREDQLREIAQDLYSGTYGGNSYKLADNQRPQTAAEWEDLFTAKTGKNYGQELATKMDFGFSDDDIKNIAEVYQNNKAARKTIGDMLTDANFHKDLDIMEKRAALADAENAYKNDYGEEPNGGYKVMLEPAKKKPVVEGPAYPEDVMNMKINRGEWGEPTGNEDYTEPTNERYSLNTDDDQGVKPRPDLYNEDVEVPDYTKPVDREGNTIKIEKRNWIQGAGERFSRAGDRIENQDIYNSLYSKTADRAIKDGTIDTLKKLGYGPQDYGEAAKVSTAVNQMVDNMVENSRAKINDPDLIDNLRNIADSDSVVLTDAQQKKLDKQIRAITENLGQGDLPYTYDADKLLKESRRLISAGGKAITQANYVNGQTQNNENAAYGNQMIEMGRYLRQRAEEATDGLFDNKYTKEQVSTMLKNAGANQATIDYVTDSNSLSDLIKKTSTFEQARQMDREMKNTPYRRNSVAGTGGKDIINRGFNRSGLGEVVDLALTPVGKVTGAVTKGIGNLMTKAGNAYAAVDQYPGLTDQGAITVANAAARNASNLASQRSNDQYYFDQNPETAQAAAAQFEAQNGLGGMNTQLGAQNALTSGMMASQGQQYQDPAKTQFVDTLNRLAAGMQNALNAGDIKAYETIADIYSQYAKIYSAQAELNGWNAAEEAEDEKLTANQQKAQAAMQQLNQLASMQPDFGTAVSNVPILGNIVGMTGGNQYATQAAALEATLVNLLSGTSATESEREQIRRAYIPQFTDSDAVKQQKLQSAYQLIQNLYNSRNNWATQVDDYANGFFG